MTSRLGSSHSLTDAALERGTIRGVRSSSHQHCHCLTRLGGHHELCSSRRTLRWRALRARRCSEAVTIATAQQAHRRGARRRSCYDRGHNACAVKTAEIAGRADAPRSDSQASSTVKLERVALSVALVVSARISALTHASTKEVLPDGERNRVCARRR